MSLITETPGLNKRANATVSISIANPSSLDDDGYVALHITDHASGETLCSVEIPAGRWHRLALGSQQTYRARVSDHLERVGKEKQTTRVALGRHSDWSDADAHDHLMDVLPDDWGDVERISVGRTNRGWEGILSRWVDAAEVTP